MGLTSLIIDRISSWSGAENSFLPSINCKVFFMKMESPACTVPVISFDRVNCNDFSISLSSSNGTYHKLGYGLSSPDILFFAMALMAMIPISFFLAVSSTLGPKLPLYQQTQLMGYSMESKSNRSIAFKATASLWAENPMKRILPASRAFWNVSMAPPGPKIWSKSSILLSA